MTARTPATERLAVNLYSGILVRYDAVSNSLMAKLKVLRNLQRRGAPLDVTVFTQGTDYRLPELRITPTASEVMLHDAFWDADVHVYEFGMWYELFNTVFVVPDGHPIVVVEHNTTPPELVDDDIVRAGCQRALIQRNNLTRAAKVACVSPFNLEVARRVGVPEERLSVLPLPPAHPPAAGTRRGFGEGAGPVHLLFLGRFVRAKGILDLLEAVESLWDNGDRRLSLTLAGNTQFADQAVLSRIQRIRERRRGETGLRLVVRPTDEQVAGLLSSADALVIPSYHEGYCVPVVEALGARCYVIGYDAGNLPNIMGGLGTLVAPGDVAGLRRAIDRFLGALRPATEGTVTLPTDRGELDFPDWDRAVEEHLRGYDAAEFERRFLSLLAETVPDGRSRSAATRAIERRLGELAS